MKTHKLVIEHQHMGKPLRKVLLEPTFEPVILGSGKNATIRLLGPEVGLIHAMLEHREDGWHFADLGSATGSWVGNESVVERRLEGDCSIRIGSHSLKVTPISLGRELFSNNGTKDGGVGGNSYHQIVIKRDGRVLESHILAADGVYETHFSGKSEHFHPPKDSKPVVKKFGNIEVIQRLVAGLPSAESEKIEMDPTFKWATAGSGVVMVILALILILAPKAPDDELELPDLEKNKYSRMIFDAKVTKEKRASAQKIVQKRLERQGPQVKDSAPTQQKARGTKVGAKVVSKIKNAGLSKLIGKIAKRATANAPIIKSRGVSPDKSSGRALASISSSSAVQGASNAAKNFQLDGIKTSGKGGGTDSYKNSSGLAAGGVGSADVGIVEEETMVAGGLDRSVIAEIIAKNIGQIRYCYERQLSADPNIYGKVLVKFNIGSSGSVTAQSVGQTTLRNAMVEGCILRRVARWKFPEPKGGTTVRVSYPFLFKSHQ